MKKNDIKFIVLLIVVVLLVGFVTYYNNIPNKTINSSDFIIKEKEESSALGYVKSRIRDICFCDFTKKTLENKLIVLTTNIDCVISREKSKKIFDFLPWGKATSKILFKDNKVQYKIPLDADKIKVEFNETTNSIRITTPSVELDHDIVEIQSKPSMIEKEENNSWMPGGPEVSDLTNEILEEVRESVLEVAEQKQSLKIMAKEQAQKVVNDFFYMIMSEYLKTKKIGLEVYIP